MNTMKFPREFIERLTPAQRIELARNPMAFAAALYAFEIARENDTKNADTPKPASDYVEIPDWLESEIVAMDNDSIAMLIRDLGLALFYCEWDVRMQSKGLSDRAYELLEFSDRDVFKSLLQWVSMELI